MRLEFINLQNDIRLLDYVRSRHEISNIPVFRLYSIIMYGEELKNLYPNQNTMNYLRDCNFGDSNTLEFDKQYAWQIISYNPSFMDFMKLLSTLQDNDETIVLTDYTHPVVLPIIDSLIKLIQQRYFIQSYIINDINDIDPLLITDFDYKEGYDNFNMDMQRYIALEQHGKQSIS